MLHILTTPSRFGIGEGRAWEEFETLCLPKGWSLRMNCKLHDVSDGVVPAFNSNARVVILGEKALSICLPSLSLAKFRGTILPVGKASATVSFHPQEAFDIKSQEDDDDSYQAQFSNEKDGSTTRPSNYFFWIRSDILKYLTKPVVKPPEFKYYVGPDHDRLITWLKTFRNGGNTIYIDIETDIETNTLRCLGIAINDSGVVVIPFYQHNNTTWYHDYSNILAELSILFSRNRVVVHNSLFDLFILSRFYRILVGHDVFDTMYVHHRIFPEIEKSLGHVISYWTWLPFHKDINPGWVRTREQEIQLWKYNALDVYSMREVYKEQIKYLAKYDDVRSSAGEACEEVYPYLLQQLQGVPVDETKLLLLRSEKNRRVKQILRICRIMSGIKLFNPGSPKQCVSYFHDKLGYDVMGRTKTGQPQMNDKCLYKLRLHYPNPLLDAIIAYRVAAKAYSMMNFVNYERPQFQSIGSNPTPPVNPSPAF